MSEVEDIEQYVGQLKVVELREELKKRHLSYTGNKSQLAQRLGEAMLKEKQEADTPAAEVSNFNFELMQIIFILCLWMLTQHIEFPSTL